MSQQRYKASRPIWALLVIIAFGFTEQTHSADKMTALTPSPPALKAPVQPAKIAIIIDDLGYNLKQGAAIARLPGAITLSILPYTPNSVALAELGFQQGKEIMLHVPMSALAARPLDIGGLTASMSEQEFITALTQSLQTIPHVRGLNNHMGSYLTQLDTPMTWLMAELAREDLFFIDSRTSPDSIAWDVAIQQHVPSLKRDVFLDNDRSHTALQQQFQQLIKKARRQGFAIAIGHPYAETHQFLSEILPTLNDLNVMLVPVSDLLYQHPEVINAATPPRESQTELTKSTENTVQN